LANLFHFLLVELVVLLDVHLGGADELFPLPLQTLQLGGYFATCLIH
jgi:hypothetical protein